MPSARLSLRRGQRHAALPGKHFEIEPDAGRDSVIVFIAWRLPQPQRNNFSRVVDIQFL
jgi:hypothetical protein